MFLEMVLSGSEEKIKLGVAKETINRRFFSDAGISLKKIEELMIPRGIVIAMSTFMDCANLEKIIIEKDVTISESAFRGCTNLKKIIMAEGVTIGALAFGLCTRLQELEISKGVTLDEGAFMRCTGLTKLIIAGHVTLDKNAFLECANLEVSIYTGINCSDIELMPGVKVSRFGLYFGKPNNDRFGWTKDSFMSRVMGLFSLCMGIANKRGLVGIPLLPLEMLDLIVRASDLCKIKTDTRSGLVLSSKKILVEKTVPDWLSLSSWNKPEPFFRGAKIVTPTV